MPYINIRLGTALSVEQRTHIQERTTRMMGALMGKRQEVTVVHIEEAPPQAWATNGFPLNEASPKGAYVDIKVTAGTNSADEKGRMISQTVEMLGDVIGVLQEACYVVIDDVPGDSWGYNGRTQADRAASRT